jgi:flagellar assembly protein FliH
VSATPPKLGRLVKGRGQVIKREVMAARDEAAALIADAVAETERRRETSLKAFEEERKRGYQQGLAEGREAAKAELTETLVKAREDAAHTREEAKEAAIPLARKMAELIVGRSLQLHQSLIVDIAAAALAAAKPRGGAVTLRVRAEDLPVLEKEHPRLVARLTNAIDLRLQVDDSVGVGGCIIDTPVATLDARLDRQLEAYEKALVKRSAGPPRP